MRSIRRISTTIGLVGLLAFTIVGCDLLPMIADPIVGEWQLASVDGVEPLLVTRVTFTESTYTGTTAGVETHTGTWTESGGTYTLTGTFFGFASSDSITPTFSDSNNTMTYSNGSGEVYVYNRR